jgi:hypothetical protein
MRRSMKLCRDLPQARNTIANYLRAQANSILRGRDFRISPICRIPIVACETHSQARTNFFQRESRLKEASRSFRREKLDADHQSELSR